MSEAAKTKPSQIPNALTSLRIILAIAFPMLTWSFRIYALILAGVTEFLDGFLARRLRAETVFGQILDPAADKIFALSAGLSLVASQQLTLFQLILIISRDIVVALGALLLVVSHNGNRLKEFRPDGLGKITTALQYFFFFFVLTESKLEFPFLILTGLFSMVAALKYIYDFTAFRSRRVAHK